MCDGNQTGPIQPLSKELYSPHESMYTAHTRHLSREREQRTLVLTWRKRVPDINDTFISQVVAISNIWNLSAEQLQGKLAASVLFAMVVATGRRVESCFCKQRTTGWRTRPRKHGALGGTVTKVPVITTQTSPLPQQTSLRHQKTYLSDGRTSLL